MTWCAADSYNRNSDQRRPTDHWASGRTLDFLKFILSDTSKLQCWDTKVILVIIWLIYSIYKQGRKLEQKSRGSPFPSLPLSLRHPSPSIHFLPLLPILSLPSPLSRPHNAARWSGGALKLRSGSAVCITCKHFWKVEGAQNRRALRYRKVGAPSLGA